jgi:phosphate starvation-inducible protein PhoH and related proteins
LNTQTPAVELTSDSADTAPQLLLHLEPVDARRLATLGGQYDCHLKQIEQRLSISIHNRGNAFVLEGEAERLQIAAKVLEQLYAETAEEDLITPDDVHLALQEHGAVAPMAAQPQQPPEVYSAIRTKKGNVKARGSNQQSYVAAIRTHDINFGVGPAGTGKTYLAVACAVESLLKDDVERILLVRPAVEAGEKLGFLPGDLSQKVDPYLRPLYDALYEMLGVEVVGKLIERQVIEIAPLAYMRGRTLNNAYVILDESQNTTREQMKMFLTRIGFGTTAVITGDPTQIDLPRGTASGLRHALEVLDGVPGISFTIFSSKDVVRHPIVQRIVEAYAAQEARENAAKETGSREHFKGDA